MDTSASVVVIIGTFLFVGFTVWGAFHSRQKVKADKHDEAQYNALNCKQKLSWLQDADWFLT